MADCILTAVDDADVQAKALTGEIGHITHVVAPIENGNDPMKYGRPDSSPTDESRIYGNIVHSNNIVNGVVEQ